MQSWPRTEVSFRIHTGHTTTYGASKLSGYYRSGVSRGAASKQFRGPLDSRSRPELATKVWHRQGRVVYGVAAYAFTCSRCVKLGGDRYRYFVESVSSPRFLHSRGFKGDASLQAGGVVSSEFHPARNATTLPIAIRLVEMPQLSVV